MTVDPPFSAMLDPSAFVDDFARRGLPSPELWPVIDQAALARLGYPQQTNAAVEILDRAVSQGLGSRPCIRSAKGTWTYAELLEKANRIAGVLVNEMGLVSGNRVLLRSANNPMLAACWFAVLKAGGIAVTTMPLLRSRELAQICNKTEAQFALCDARLADEPKRRCRCVRACSRCGISIAIVSILGSADEPSARGFQQHPNVAR